MTPITLQAIFDAGYQAFVVEKRPPARDPATTLCRYLTEDGHKCAVGLLLPDGHPAQQQEAPLSYLVKRYPELFDIQLRHLPQHNLNRFQQLLHDDLLNRKTGEWKYKNLRRRYALVAKEYGLTLPEEKPT